MVILAIHRKRKMLYSVHIDEDVPREIEHRDENGDVLLDLSIVSKYDLQVGSKLDDYELVNIYKESEIQRAKSRIMWLLQYRDYSEKKIREKLYKEYPQFAIDEAIESCKERNYIDDERYALRKAEIFLNERSYSYRQAYNKLLQNGIESSVAKNALDTVNADPKKNIKKLIETKYKKYLRFTDGEKKIISALIRRGYYISDIKEVLENYMDLDDFNPYE